LDTAFKQSLYTASNMLNKKPSLLDDPNIAKRYDQEAQKDVFILNDNPEIKKKWFAQKGILDDGTEIDIYDGTIVRTLGSESTTFNINNHPGARVTKEGELILSDGTEISHGTITKQTDGSIHVDNGDVDLSTTSKSNIFVRDGFVYIDDRTYSNNMGYEFQVSKNGNKLTINGKVDEIGIDDRLSARMNGKITIYDDGHFNIGQDSSYSSYINGRESTKYSVDKSTDIYIYNSKKMNPSFSCSSSQSCVIHNYYTGKMDVNTVDNTKLEIDSNDFSITDLSIAEISDSSIVKFKDKSNVELIFNNDKTNPIQYKGNINTIATNIQTQSTVNNKLLTFKIEDGEFLICSSHCKLCGSITQLPKKPHKIKSILQINANPDWIPTDNQGKPLYSKSGEKDLEDYYKREYNGIYNFKAIEPDQPISDADISYVLGHHWNGEDKIWRDTGSIKYEDFPNSKILVLGACHTIQNPEHLYKEIQNIDPNRKNIVSEQFPNFEVDMDGRYQYQTAEATIQAIQNNNPNLRMIMGYQTSAPAYDKFLKKSLSKKNIEILNNQGYEAFMNSAMREATKTYGRIADSRGEISLPAESYSLTKRAREALANGDHVYSSYFLTPGGKKEGKRVAFYYRDDAGTWKYYSWDHPKGIPLDFQKSNKLYQEAFKQSVK